MVEQLPLKQRVGGSSPPRLTTSEGVKIIGFVLILPRPALSPVVPIAHGALVISLRFGPAVN